MTSPDYPDLRQETAVPWHYTALAAGMAVACTALAPYAPSALEGAATHIPATSPAINPQRIDGQNCLSYASQSGKLIISKLSAVRTSPKMLDGPVMNSLGLTSVRVAYVWDFCYEKIAGEGWYGVDAWTFAALVNEKTKSNADHDGVVWFPETDVQFVHDTSLHPQA